MRKFRKPYFAVLLSALVLFISCEQNNIDHSNFSFDYSVFNQFDADNFEQKYNLKSANSNTIANEQLRLDRINRQYGTSIHFPDTFLGLIDENPENVEAIALANGWLNQNDIYLIDEFENDLKNTNFNAAIRNYENNVLNLNLNSSEFAKQNLVVNSLRSLNDRSPEVFENTTYSCCNWGCLRAAAALIVTSVALASCVTVIACGLAVTGWILSYATYIENCTDLT